MKQAIIFGILVLSIVLSLYLIRVLQQKIQPRASAQRLFAFIAFSLVVAIVITFCMVLVILGLFPGELIK